MLVDTPNAERRVRTLWARVCKGWGIHHVHGTRTEAREEEEIEKQLYAKGWCGPHQIEKLIPARRIEKR